MFTIFTFWKMSTSAEHTPDCLQTYNRVNTLFNYSLWGTHNAHRPHKDCCVMLLLFHYLIHQVGGGGPLYDCKHYIITALIVIKTTEPGMRWNVIYFCIKTLYAPDEEIVISHSYWCYHLLQEVMTSCRCVIEHTASLYHKDISHTHTHTHIRQVVKYPHPHPHHVQGKTHRQKGR